MEIQFVYINVPNVGVSLLQVKETLKTKILVYYIALNVEILYLILILLMIEK